MLKTIGIIVIAIVAVVAGILIYAATRPNSFHVQRSVEIKAPAEKIFALINDFARWPSWSPYEGKDPAMRRDIGAVTAGTGATYGWSGNNKVGEGRMEILESTAPSRILIKLDFLRPIEGHNTATFTLEPKDDATEVTWAIDGPSPFIAKVMGLVFNMDRMIGADFEVGLANLKRLAEQ